MYFFTADKGFIFPIHNGNLEYLTRYISRLQKSPLYPFVKISVIPPPMASYYYGVLQAMITRPPKGSAHRLAELVNITHLIERGGIKKTPRKSTLFSTPSLNDSCFGARWLRPSFRTPGSIKASSTPKRLITHS